MEEILDKNTKLKPKCKCCLGEEDLKDMWTVFTEDDEPEIYGEMLNECFALPWEHQDDDTEFICEFCVQRLKDAVSFKNQIVFAHDIMQDNTDLDTTVDEDGRISYKVKMEKEEEMSETGEELWPVKAEPTSDEVEYLEIEYIENLDEATTSVPETKSEASSKKRKQTFYSDLEKCVTTVQTELMSVDEAAEYFNVPKKALVQELKKKNVGIPTEEAPTSSRSTREATRSKRSKKKKFEEFVVMEEDEGDVEYLEAEFLSDGDDDYQVEYEEPEEEETSFLTKENKERVNVRYTEAQLQKCMNAVLQKEMSRMTASKRFKIPYKTLCSKLRNCSTEEDKTTDAEPEQEETSFLTKENKERVYVRYTEAQLQKCMNAVLHKGMSRMTASKRFKIPYKTLCSKLRNCSAEEDKTTDKGTPLSIQKHQKLIEEIKLLLTYTNITPFKSKACRYYCAYCTGSKGPEGRFYEDTNMLRSHVRTEHTNDKFTGVKEFLKPQTLNEISKFDIKNLNCTVCCEPLDSWNGMFQHLAEKHQVEFDEAYTRVIPFVLEKDLSCALCDMKFDSFNQVDTHMNCHYTNYVCGSCGDTFMSQARLKKHEETHEIGRYECQYCDKVFSLNKYRKKHTYSVHLPDKKFKCQYCKEAFQSNYIRYQHMIEKHDVEAKTYECEECNKSFNWKPYYLKHLRLKHKQKVKKHECLLCGKKFSMNYELRNHYEWHQGSTKHVCPICDKKFASNQYLQKHVMKNHAEIRLLTTE